MGTTRENKVLAPIQNLNNKREKDTKITVSKSCHLVDLQEVLIENNWLDFAQINYGQIGSILFHMERCRLFTPKPFQLPYFN